MQDHAKPTRLYLVDVPESEQTPAGPHFRILLEVGQVPLPGQAVPADLEPFIRNFRDMLRQGKLETLMALPLPIEIPLLSRMSTGRLSTDDE
jgi:hypothetical protein